MAAPSDYLADTNVVLALTRNNDLGQYLDATYRLSAVPPSPLISIVSTGELFALAAKFGWGVAKRAALATRLADFVQVNLDDAIVQAYAAIDAASYAVGHTMGKNDLWIAATARVLGLTLLTTDTDFRHLHPTWMTVEWVDPASKLTP